MPEPIFGTDTLGQEGPDAGGNEGGSELDQLLGAVRGEDGDPSDGEAGTQDGSTSTEEGQEDDLSTDGQQQTEGNDGADKQEGPQEGHPKLYAGKYRTTEELVRAYEEAQRTLTQTAQERAQLARTLAQLGAQQQAGHPQEGQERAGQVDPDEFLTKFMTDPVNALLDVISPAIDQRVKPLTQGEKVREFQAAVRAIEQNAEKYPHFQEVRGQMADLLEQLGEDFIERVGTRNAMNLVYQAAVGSPETMKALQEKAAQAGRTAAEKQLAEKLAAGSRGATISAETRAGQQGQQKELDDLFGPPNEDQGGVFG